MLEIKIHVETPEVEDILGIKEAIAVDLEKYGGIRVVSVIELQPEQIQM